MTNGALEGFRVLDLSGNIAGAFCAKFLGDYGADVIKVEPPGLGDRTRSLGPFFRDDPHPEKSLLFLYLNCNKRGITLNPESSAGKRVLFDLVRTADVVIESYRPGHLQDIGLEYERLSQINPQLVLTSITPFGQTGPYSQDPGSYIVYEAMGGIMYTSGAYNREPLSHGHPQSEYIGGITAAYATSAALFARRLTGEGQHVDVSLTEVVAMHHSSAPVRYSYTGGIERRAPKHEPGSPKGGAHFEGIVPVKDGYVGATFQRGAGRRGTLADYLKLLGHPELVDPSFETPAFGRRLSEEHDDLLLSVLKEWSKFDYFNTAAGHSWVAAVVQTSEDLANSPQLNERGFFSAVNHPVIGEIKVPGEVFRLPLAPYRLRYPAPLLGQHNIEVFCSELGYSRGDLVKLRQLGAI